MTTYTTDVPSVPTDLTSSKAVITKPELARQIVEHRNAILARAGQPDEPADEPMVFRTNAGTVLTLDERNYLVQRSNGVDTDTDHDEMERLIAEAPNGTDVAGTVKGTDTRSGWLPAQVDEARAKYGERASSITTVDGGDVLLGTVRVGVQNLSGRTRWTEWYIRNGAVGRKAASRANGVKGKAHGIKGGRPSKCGKCGECRNCKRAANQRAYVERKRMEGHNLMANKLERAIELTAAERAEGKRSAATTY